jgi:hypothetical protein
VLLVSSGAYVLGLIDRRPLQCTVLAVMKHGIADHEQHPIAATRFIIYGTSRTGAKTGKAYTPKNGVVSSDTFLRLNGLCWAAHTWRGTIVTGSFSVGSAGGR